jgi:hypothetical protein
VSALESTAAAASSDGNGYRKCEVEARVGMIDPDALTLRAGGYYYDWLSQEQTCFLRQCQPVIRHDVPDCSQ